MMSSRFFAGFAALFLLLFSASEVQAKNFTSESFTLQNGLRVVVVPNHKVAAVTHMICYQVGAADDPYGKSGIAHFLEHLMFKGTKKFKKGEYSALVAKNGGNENAYTSHDYTAYFQTIAVGKLPLVMELEADRMRGLQLSKQEVLKERDVILEERSMRIDNDPKVLLQEQMNAALFLNHPYHRPVIGWRHEMEGLTLEDASKYYRTYYAPNNAILIVAGDITASQLKPLAEKYYGKIERSIIPPRMHPVEPPAISARRVELVHENVHVSQLMRVYMATNVSPKGVKEGAALTILSHILAGSDISRLYQSLVEKRAIAASVESEYDPISIGPAVFVLSLTPRQGQSIAALEKALDEELKLFLEQGVTKEELARVKKLVRTESIYQKESFKTLAFLFGHVLSSGLPISYLDTWENTINAVSIEDVNKAAKELLVPTKSVTGILLPKVEK